MRGKRFIGTTALLVLFCCSCRNPGHPATGDETDRVVTDPEDFPQPERPAGHILLARTTGDLDDDGIVDLAIAWSEPAVSGKSAARKLILYKAGPAAWRQWHASVGPLMGSMDDDLAGDPFHSLEIDNGTLLITHTGGNSRRWDYLHRYRFDGTDWVLTGATLTYGELCDTFTTLDYNLITGTVDVNSETGNCDETGTEVPGKGDAKLRQFVRKSTPVKMDGFHPGVNEISTPDGALLYY